LGFLAAAKSKYNPGISKASITFAFARPGIGKLVLRLVLSAAPERWELLACSVTGAMDQSR
jgi:hypothetical protein